MEKSLRTCMKSPWKKVLELVRGAHGKKS